MFTGFTISQAGLVRHWHSQCTPRWLLRAALNGTGAILTATATAVLVATKFTSGAWVVVLTVPALMLLFSRIQNYYHAVGLELDLGQLPHRPLPAKSLVIVPVGSISKLTEHALHAALSLSDDVIAVLIPEVQPRRWRYRILQNQRGLLLATVLRASTDVVICTIPYRLTTR